MIMSMTGFGSREAEIPGFGKIRAELRSINHKFLEIVLRLPEGFLSLEERIAKEIETKIKRGRLTCAINIIGGSPASVFINKKLLKNYLSAIRGIKGEFHIADGVSINTLMHLPGVISLTQSDTSKTALWPRLKILISQASDDLLKTKRREGGVLEEFLKARARGLQADIGIIKARFKKAEKDKLAKLKTDEERSSFLKNADITEEIVRLSFHARNFTAKLFKGGQIGKELDFITQEMQREANTIGAKSCDTVISGQVIQIKSRVEKIREQLQNIE